MPPMPRKRPATASPPAVNRLHARCPQGPPYAVLVLDRESVEALTLGAVNSRVMVEACRVLAAMDPQPLPADYQP